MDPLPEIATERLTLRRWKQADRAPFARICADPEVMRYIGDGSTATPAEAARSIERFEHEWECSGYGLFAVELVATGDMIGFVGLSKPDFLPEILPAIEIGWRLARPHWGFGYACEGARAVLAATDGRDDYADIVSICRSENTTSERVMRKIGMTLDRRTTHPKHGYPLTVYRLRH
ncbi:GNAT family N-acetyltransferase [Pararhizobium mangrovi]|uniref:GNAT family N-acetyltransferase n=1 Tax=Pararhizobium mangrovi TaxID=2590452 RepID=A0A506U971_9HYPH|nr:GNAT family N-acetyltransferase [Pararhizobium mangrovi]TPW29631.1 GNAT family N-acetyltransferase [Pararhizobium mangrovi]